MAESTTSKPRVGDTRYERASDSQPRGIVDKVRQSATSQLTNQKNRALDGLDTVAQAVHQTSQQLRDEKHDAIAGYVDEAVNQIERLSQQLRQRDIAELFHDLQQLSQRQPALFIGGAFVLGLVGGRFLKSSSDRSFSFANRDRYARSRADRANEYRGYARAEGEIRFRAREVATVHDYDSAHSSLDDSLNATADDAESSGQSNTADTGMNTPESGDRPVGGRFRRGTQTERT